MTAIGCVLLLLSGCSEQSPARPTPLQTTPGVQAGPQPSTTWTISGTVWEHGYGRVTVAQQGTVFGWLEIGSGRGSGPAQVDVDGRYEFQVPAGIARVRLLSSTRFQPCAVTLEPRGNTSADLHVVTDRNQLGAQLPSTLPMPSPTLSGVVYEQTPAGRQPLQGAWVTLDSAGGLGEMAADTLTDADGRYVLCGVTYGPSMAMVVGLQGFEVFYSFDNFTGVTTLDIEMKRTGAQVFGASGAQIREFTGFRVRKP